MKILVTGSTGKVGRNLIEGLLKSPDFSSAEIVAFCHKRIPPTQPRVTVVRGNISDAVSVSAAMQDATHVFHLATVKETPDDFVDVSVKGLLNVLEAARSSKALRQIVLLGGDAAVGHCFVKHDRPVTEETPRQAYPGVYALSKVLEEVMVEQYSRQYGLATTILRAPWIMEKDDFRMALSFGPDQFGGPSWDSLISPGERQRYATEIRVPLLMDAGGKPLLRNFVHISDLIAACLAAIKESTAIGQTFNVAMTEPVDYGIMAGMLGASRGMPPAIINTGFHSNILSNEKARQLMRWRPRIDLGSLIEMSFSYVRQPDDKRQVWYPG